MGSGLFEVNEYFFVNHLRLTLSNRHVHKRLLAGLPRNTTLAGAYAPSELFEITVNKKIKKESLLIDISVKKPMLIYGVDFFY